MGVAGILGRRYPETWMDTEYVDFKLDTVTVMMAIANNTP